MSLGSLTAPNIFNLYAGNFHVENDLIVDGSLDVATLEADTFNVVGTNDSSNSTTGALVVAGGVGVAKNLNVGGNLVTIGSELIESTTDSINDVKIGALVVAGGVGISKKMTIGDNIISYGSLTVTNSTDSTDTNTGAVKIQGGVGIWKNVTIGQSLYLPTSGGTATGLNYYEVLDMDILFNLFASSAVPTKFTRIGRLVSMVIPEWSAQYSSNANNPLTYSSFDNQIPERFRPTANLITAYSRLKWQDTGLNPFTYLDGYISISSSGQISYATYNKGTTDYTLNVGAMSCSVTWYV